MDIKVYKTKEEVEESLFNILYDFFNGEISRNFLIKKDLINNFHLDSLDLLGLFMKIEKAFNLNPEVFEKPTHITNIQSIINKICKEKKIYD